MRANFRAGFLRAFATEIARAGEQGQGAEVVAELFVGLFDRFWRRRAQRPSTSEKSSPAKGHLDQPRPSLRHRFGIAATGSATAEPDCGALITPNATSSESSAKLPDRSARLVDDPKAHHQHRDRRQGARHTRGDFAADQTLVGEPDPTADDQGRQPGIGDARVEPADRGGDLLIVCPLPNGLRPKARPSSSRNELQDENQPSQTPLRNIDEALQ